MNVCVWEDGIYFISFFLVRISLKMCKTSIIKLSSDGNRKTHRKISSLFIMSIILASLPCVYWNTWLFVCLLPVDSWFTKFAENLPCKVHKYRHIHSYSVDSVCLHLVYIYVLVQNNLGYYFKRYAIGNILLTGSLYI